MYNSGKNNWDFYSSGLYRILISLMDSLRAWLFRMSWSRNCSYNGRPPVAPHGSSQPQSGDKNSSYRYYNRKYPYQTYHGGYRPEGQSVPPTGVNQTPSPSGQNASRPGQSAPTQPDGSYHYSYKKAAPPKAKQPSKTNIDNAHKDMEEQTKETKKGVSLVPYLSILVCIVLYILLFPLSQWYDFLILGLLTLSVFLLMLHFFPGKKRKVKREEKAKLKPTGNREIDKMIVEGNKMLEEMRQANVAIENEEISNEISKLEKTTEKIFRYVAENPKKASQIRKFMNYYLPTTLKLLHSYDRLSEQEIDGENITGTMHNIEGIMHTIVLAFERQLDYLFQDEAMDIATDITVLEGMMAQEGLTNTGPKATGHNNRTQK
ncbi:MAG: hypothetical protein HFE39_06110 [Clostridiales bacterium]|jgi:5-bromo-4-chloroindolyl phosphate hydrolysis protein|nr:hypothetical protein [Clostridiales bacterium]